MTTQVLKLYEIVDEIDTLLDQVAEAEGELTPEVEKALSEWGAKFDEKVERVIMKIRNLEATGKAMKEEGKRLNDGAKARTNDGKRLRVYLLHQMKALGRDKVETAIGKIWRGKSARPTIIWTGEGDPPKEAMKLVPEHWEVDGNLLYDLWKEKKLPTGFDATQTEFVTIK